MSVSNGAPSANRPPRGAAVVAARQIDAIVANFIVYLSPRCRSKSDDDDDDDGDDDDVMNRGGGRDEDGQELTRQSDCWELEAAAVVVPVVCVIRVGDVGVGCGCG